MTTDQRTINEEIQLMIDHTIGQQLTPQKVFIAKVYSDNVHVDATTLNGDTLSYVPTISNTPTKDNIGILLFLEHEEPIIITK